LLLSKIGYQKIGFLYNSIINNPCYRFVTVMCFFEDFWMKKKQLPGKTRSKFTSRTKNSGLGLIRLGDWDKICVLIIYILFP